MLRVFALVLFALGLHAAGPARAQDAVTCESRDNRYRECRGFEGRARLDRALSDAPCIERPHLGHAQGHDLGRPGLPGALCPQLARRSRRRRQGSHDPLRKHGQPHPRVRRRLPRPGRAGASTVRQPLRGGPQLGPARQQHLGQSGLPGRVCRSPRRRPLTGPPAGEVPAMARATCAGHRSPPRAGAVCQRPAAGQRGFSRDCRWHRAWAHWRWPPVPACCHWPPGRACCQRRPAWARRRRRLRPGCASCPRPS